MKIADTVISIVLMLLSTVGFFCRIRLSGNGRPRARNYLCQPVFLSALALLLGTLKNADAKPIPTDWKHWLTALLCCALMSFSCSLGFLLRTALFIPAMMFIFGIRKRLLAYQYSARIRSAHLFDFFQVSGHSRTRPLFSISGLGSMPYVEKQHGIKRSDCDCWRIFWEA
jgi:hypothetical protein